MVLNFNPITSMKNGIMNKRYKNYAIRLKKVQIRREIWSSNYYPNDKVIDRNFRLNKNH